MTPERAHDCTNPDDPCDLDCFDRFYEGENRREALEAYRKSRPTLPTWEEEAAWNAGYTVGVARGQ